MARIAARLALASQAVFSVALVGANVAAWTLVPGDPSAGPKAIALALSNAATIGFLVAIWRLRP